MARVRKAGEGRTRWSRFGMAAGVGTVTLGALVFGIAQGALALPLNIGLSGVPFTLSATSIDANHFAQYAYPDQLGPAGGQMAPIIGALAKGTVNDASAAGNTYNSGSAYYAADTITQLGSGVTITGLKQSICAPVPALPGKAIRVHIVGDGTTTATNMTIQAPALTASSAAFTNFAIGQTVGQSVGLEGLTSPYASGDPASQVSLAQHASHVTLSNVNQVGLGTSADTFNLGGLRVWAEFVDAASCAS